LGHHARPEVPVPVRGAVDAGGDAAACPDDDRLRATGSPHRMAAHRGPLQPGDADPRGRAPGLHRRRHLGRHLAGAPLPRRAARGAQRARPARHAAHGRLTAGLADRVRSTLERNWVEGEREGTRYAYTRPSPSRYPWQWYWDSCFAAISWRRFE